VPSYVDEKKAEELRAYEVLGLVAALRDPNGHTVGFMFVGDGGLGGWWMASDRNAETADVW
jgi:hypothetical protein